MNPARIAVCFFLIVGAVVNGQINLSGNAVPDSSSSTVVEMKLHDVVPIEAIGLENVFRLTEQIFSGSEPDGKVGFDSLKNLGIKTIVSVDGAKPKTDFARESGMRYIHIPIGYDGISQQAGAMLAQLVTEATGPIYIHCHHGKHRGPAAAAVACLAAGSVDRRGAQKILEQAGTSKDYAGLWRDVQEYTVPDASDVLPPLVEVADVGSLATAMADIDRIFDNVKRLRAAEWKAPVDHPDLDASHEALMLQESFHEAARNLEPPYDETLKQQLLKAESEVQQLRSMLKANDSTTATQQAARIEASCKSCHRIYRDVPSGRHPE